MLYWKGPNFAVVQAPITEDEVYGAVGPLITVQRNPITETLKAPEKLSALVEEENAKDSYFTTGELKELKEGIKSGQVALGGCSEEMHPR